MQGLTFTNRAQQVVAIGLLLGALVASTGRATAAEERGGHPDAQDETEVLGVSAVAVDTSGAESRPGAIPDRSGSWALAPDAEGQWLMPLEVLGAGDVLLAESPDEPIVVDLTDTGGVVRGFHGELVAGGHAVRVTIGDDHQVRYEVDLEPGEVHPISIEVDEDADALVFSAIRLDDNECDVLVREHLFRLRRGVVRIDATEPGDPVGDLKTFLRSGVGAIHIGAHHDRSPIVDRAALEAAAILSRRYPGAQFVTVGDVSSASGERTPFRRVIRLVEDDQPGLLLSDGVLVISGSGDSLLAQVRALDTDAVRVAGLTQVTAIEGVAEEEPRRLGVQLPITEVARRTQVTGAYHLELPIVADQAFFGGPVERYEVRLGGIASPPPGNAARDVQLSLHVGDELVDVIELARNGRFDTQLVLEGEAIERSTVMRLVLDGVRTCGDRSQWSLQLDHSSWIRADAGQALPPGFERFPQNALNGLSVYVGDGIEELGLAAALVGKLQEESPHLIDLSLIERAAAESPSGTVLAVGADADLLAGWQAPLIPGRHVGDATMSLRIDAMSTTHDLMLQAFSAHGRADVLAANVAGHTGMGLPPALAGAVWADLRGNTAIAAEDDLSLALTTSGAPARQDLLADLTAPDDRSSRSLFVTGLATAMVVAVAGLVVNRVVGTMRRRARLTA